MTFKLFVEMRSHYVAQTGPELPRSSDPPASDSRTSCFAAQAGVQAAHCNLQLLGSRDSPASASQVAGTTENTLALSNTAQKATHPVQLSPFKDEDIETQRDFYSFIQARVQWHYQSSLQPQPPRLKQSPCFSLPIETGFQHVAQAGLNLVICPPRPPKLSPSSSSSDSFKCGDFLKAVGRRVTAGQVFLLWQKEGQCEERVGKGRDRFLRRTSVRPQEPPPGTWLRSDFVVTVLQPLSTGPQDSKWHHLHFCQYTCKRASIKINGREKICRIPD
ncbi:hypothetical protein AAY473_036844 [Plecturocebus cupreus]